MTKTKVYINDIFCGILVEHSDGYTFRYDAEYLKSDGAVPLSPTMPLQETEYEKEFLFPVFDGLIPEGWMLDIVDKTWKINPRDRMKLLITCCKDCIGNISVSEYEEQDDQEVPVLL